MTIQMTTKVDVQKMPLDKLEICQRCKNAYILIWLVQGEEYNDFGLRCCPFCGLTIDENTGSILE